MRESRAEPVVRVDLNGEPRALPAPASVRSALETLGLVSRSVAVELNGRLVRKRNHEETPIREGDRVEIVTFVGGG